MKEPFFADINWAKLEKRQLDPPAVLRKTKSSAEETGVIQSNEQDELSMLFENPEPLDMDRLDGDEQRGGG